MSKHTPGPWQCSAQDPMQLGGCAYVWPKDTGQTIAEVQQSMHTQANARLIAAAPDLLAALELVSDWYYSSPSQNAGLTEAEVSDTVRAAIRKAKGE